MNGDAEAPGASGETAAEALGRARDHARTAAAESVAALRALLDAAALGVSSVPAEQHHLLSTLARMLDDLSDRFASTNTDVSASILAALDAEIARWEARSQDDPDSRAVLRAFLGLREILWEFGIRSSGPAAPTPSEGSPAARQRSKPQKKPRVQRVEVQG